MQTLLRIDTSIRTKDAYSRDLANHFQNTWSKENPSGKIIYRDLATSPIQHLSESALLNPASVISGDSINDLITELEDADQILISAPLYNFSIPSALKAYIDHVVQAGKTFELRPDGYRGLLADKPVCVVTTCGAPTRPPQEPPATSFHRAYLQQVFDVIGLKKIDFVTLEGTSIQGDQLDKNQLTAERDLEDAVLAHTQNLDACEKIGTLSQKDIRQINALRARQVSAILSGDAQSYANLCTDDITLMLQGSDLVSGREEFITCETALFQNTNFEALKQSPIRLIRNGPLLVEIGEQELEISKDSAEAESYKAKRKYCHTLRHTDHGWKFAILMSNNSL